MIQAGYVYNILLNKKKERFDIILEPLQAFLQLALLSFTPIESKLNINNNILYIQIPGWKQSILRTYYSDSKNDLFYLFNVIKRFNLFYKHLENINNNETNLLFLLRKLAKTGIDNLLQTYKQTDNPALLHTLNLYKDIINKSNLQEIENNEKNNNYVIENISLFPNSYPSSPKSDLSSSPTQLNNKFNQTDIQNISKSNNMDLDKVFINITNLYSNYDLIIIFNSLLLIQSNPNNYFEYIEGLNKILEPINIKIKKWIVDNIVY